MSPVTWSLDPYSQIRAFEERRGTTGAGALFSWACFCVESLYYLDDLDRAVAADERPLGHGADVVDLAHTRWATGTAITALDLCAAGLGRAFCGVAGEKDMAVSWLDPQSKKARTWRSQLPTAAVAWVDSLLSDRQYQKTKEARDWLTHSRVTRHLSIGGGTRKRLELGLTSGTVGVRTVITEARDVATGRVTEFVQLLPRL